MIFALQNNRVFRTYAGGRRIDRLVGTNVAETCYPEDWIASAVRALNPGRENKVEGLSRTADGSILGDLIRESPVCMLGVESIARFGKTMPILTKFLDSDERLVIQVHPTNAFAKEHFHSNFGKTECWYILDADERAHVYLGFREGITRAEWQRFFDTQDVPGMLRALHDIPVRKGDCLLVRGGVPHAIGGGMLMVELQEPTDLMVIPERRTPSGKSLPDAKLHCGLGFDKIMDCFVYEGLPRTELLRRYRLAPVSIDATRRVLAGVPQTDQFTMEELRVRGGYTLPAYQRALVAIATEGNGTLEGTSACPLKPGDRFFISADEGGFTIRGNLRMLLCYGGARRAR